MKEKAVNQSTVIKDPRSLCAGEFCICDIQNGVCIGCNETERTCQTDLCNCTTEFKLEGIDINTS